MSEPPLQPSSNDPRSSVRPDISPFTSMTETQSIPSLPPLQFVHSSPPRSAQPIQLPPLASIGRSPLQSEHHWSPSSDASGLASLHLASIQSTRPLSRSGVSGSRRRPAALSVDLGRHRTTQSSITGEKHLSPSYEHRGASPRVTDRPTSQSVTGLPLFAAPYLDTASRNTGDVHGTATPSPSFSSTRTGQQTPTHTEQSNFSRYPLARHTSTDSVLPRRATQDDTAYRARDIRSPYPYAQGSHLQQPDSSQGSSNRISLPAPVSGKPLSFELRVRQQPIAARACGFGERDRRVIDPPPIIELVVRDTRTGANEIDELRYSLSIVHCTLWNHDGTREESALEQPDRRKTQRLMGQLVASPSVAKDEHNVEGCFFCFPDLSCRTNGRYRLRFIMMQLEPYSLHVGGSSPILCEVLSDAFTVYTAKDFPGMRPSSALTRALKLQGCNIQVKKGNEKALARKRQSFSEAEGAAPALEDAQEESSTGAKKVRQELA